MQTKTNHLPNGLETDVIVPTLIIHLPDCNYTFETDNIEVLNELSDFCKTTFNASWDSEEMNELTIDGYWSEDDDYAFKEKIFELGLI